MNKKYVVTLEADERRQLRELLRVGRAAAYKRRHAEVLLKADAGPQGPAWTDERMAEAFGISVRGLVSVRQRFVTEGLAAALGRRQDLKQYVLEQVALFLLKSNRFRATSSAVVAESNKSPRVIRIVTHYFRTC